MERFGKTQSHDTQHVYRLQTIEYLSYRNNERNIIPNSGTRGSIQDNRKGREEYAEKDTECVTLNNLTL